MSQEYPLRRQLFGYIPLVAIFAKEISKLCYLVRLHDAGDMLNLLAPTWLGLMIIFSIVIGLISDNYCRQKTLIFTLLASVASLILLLQGRFWLAVIVDGIFSAVTPVARAAYTDIHAQKDRISVLSDTFMAQALPWALLCFDSRVFNNHLFPVAFVVFFVALFLMIFVFRDLRDKDAKKKLNHFHVAVKKYLKGYSLRLLVAFLFFNMAFQLTNYYTENYAHRDQLQIVLLMVEGVGIFAGCLFVKVAHLRASFKSLILVFSAGLLIFAFSALTALFTEQRELSLYKFLVFAFVGGVSLPLIYGYYSKRVRAHDEGMLYGLLEGVQILAEALIPLFILADALLIPHETQVLTATPFLILIGLGLLLILKKERKANY